MSINPGYRAIVRKEHFVTPAGGQNLRCPKCKAILAMAIADRIKIKCKNCGRWIYLEKIREQKKLDIL